MATRKRKKSSKKSKTGKKGPGKVSVSAARKAGAMGKHKKAYKKK